MQVSVLSLALFLSLPVVADWDVLSAILLSNVSQIAHGLFRPSVIRDWEFLVISSDGGSVRSRLRGDEFRADWKEVTLHLNWKTTVLSAWDAAAATHPAATEADTCAPAGCLELSGLMTLIMTLFARWNTLKGWGATPKLHQQPGFMWNCDFNSRL